MILSPCIYILFPIIVSFLSCFLLCITSSSKTSCKNNLDRMQHAHSSGALLRFCASLQGCHFHLFSSCLHCSIDIVGVSMTDLITPTHNKHMQRWFPWVRLLHCLLEVRSFLCWWCVNVVNDPVDFSTTVKKHSLTPHGNSPGHQRRYISE